MSLRSRYFPSREEQEAIAAQEKGEEEYAVGVAEEFVRMEGFKNLEEWIADQLFTSEVAAGDHAAMLASVGFREGLRRVQSHLTQIKKIAKGETHV